MHTVGGVAYNQLHGQMLTCCVYINSPWKLSLARQQGTVQTLCLLVYPKLEWQCHRKMEFLPLAATPSRMDLEKALMLWLDNVMCTYSTVSERVRERERERERGRGRGRGRERERQRDIDDWLIEKRLALHLSIKGRGEWLSWYIVCFDVYHTSIHVLQTSWVQKEADFKTKSTF